MEKLPKHLFDRDYYYKANPDVLHAGMDAYTHYYDHGVNEKQGLKQRRDACLKFDELTLDQVRHFYYHTVPDDPFVIEVEKLIGNIPYYLRSTMASHLPVLEFYASKCKHITEFGIRHGHSTIAFLYGLPEDGKLESYDIIETPFVTWLKSKSLNKWNFNRNTLELDVKINSTDLVFFNADCFYKNFGVLAANSKKYVAFYNTMPAMPQIASDNQLIDLFFIEEYIKINKCKVVYKTEFCNGLIILEKP